MPMPEFNTSAHICAMGLLSCRGLVAKAAARHYPSTRTTHPHMRRRHAWRVKGQSMEVEHHGTGAANVRVVWMRSSWVCSVQEGLLTESQLHPTVHLAWLAALLTRIVAIIA